MYIVISKPKRHSIAVGVSHFMDQLLKALREFQPSNCIMEGGLGARNGRWPAPGLLTAEWSGIAIPAQIDSCPEASDSHDCPAFAHAVGSAQRALT